MTQLWNKFDLMRTKTYFEAMKEAFFKQKELCLRLANLATLMDHQML